MPVVLNDLHVTSGGRASQDRERGAGAPGRGTTPLRGNADDLHPWKSGSRSMGAIEAAFEKAFRVASSRQT